MWNIVIDCRLIDFTILMILTRLYAFAFQHHYIVINGIEMECGIKSFCKSFRQIKDSIKILHNKFHFGIDLLYKRLICRNVHQFNEFGTKILLKVEHFSTGFRNYSRFLYSVFHVIFFMKIYNHILSPIFPKENFTIP